MTRMILHPLEHRAAKALSHAMVVLYHMQILPCRLFSHFFLKAVGQNLKCDVTKNCTIGVKGLKLVSNNLAVHHLASTILRTIFGRHLHC